ncbi:MAG: peptidase, partial [Actinomycetota bacterium]
MSTAPGPLALVGSGEYQPSMQAIEAGLIAVRAPRYIQIATAAVPDGEAVVAKWERMGREQASRIGVEAVTVTVRTRTDAENPELVDLLT